MIKCSLKPHTHRAFKSKWVRKHKAMTRLLFFKKKKKHDDHSKDNKKTWENKEEN